jgi:hypothetical protein
MIVLLPFETARDIDDLRAKQKLELWEVQNDF